MASKGPKPGTKPSVAAKSAAPAVAKLAPVAAKAAPVVAKPAAPVAPKPAPVVAKVAAPAPVAPKPAPVATAPVAPKPKPVTPVQEPAKAVITPAPVSVAATPSKEENIMATNFETATAKPAAMLGDLTDRAKTSFAKGGKVVEEMNDFAKGNVEAIVESSRIAAKGFESMGQDAAEYSRKSFENATSVFKSMASVKSPTELFKLHSDFMRSYFDSAVAEASKSTEAMLKLTGEAVQPISNRFAVAVEKVKTAA